MMDRNRPERRLRKELKELREHVLRDERQNMPGSSRSDMAERLAQGKPLVWGSLDYLSHYISAHGCVRVLDGDAGGFGEIDLACLYGFWMFRIGARAYDLITSPKRASRSPLMDHLATCWMHAEAIGARGIREWLDGLVQRVDAGEDVVDGKDMSPLCTLMAHFVTGKRAEVLEASGWAPIDIYRPVTDGTFDASQWDALASWHQENTDRGDYPPFYSAPYRLIPFELMAISRRTGIPISGTNPLLHTPLAVMREVPEIAMTDELQAVIDCARRVYGEV